MIVPLSYYEVINSDNPLDESVQTGLPEGTLTTVYTPPVIAPTKLVSDNDLYSIPVDSQPIAPINQPVTQTAPIETSAPINSDIQYQETAPIFQAPIPVTPIDAGTVETGQKTNYLPYVLGGVGVLLLLSSKKKKKGVGKIENKDLMTLALAGGLLLSFDLIKRFFEGIGIWKSADTKNIDAEETNPDSAFNPNFYKQYVNYTYAITGQQALDYAAQIYNAFGAFNDCEECVMNVFYALRTKSNVSFLADKFAQQYGQSLLPFLRGGWWPQDRLSDSDLNTILQYVSKLPNN